VKICFCFDDVFDIERFSWHGTILMTSKQTDYPSKESKKRLQAILHGAFAGPPTKLKDIPKKSGESRAKRKQDAKSRSSASRPRPAGP